LRLSAPIRQWRTRKKISGNFRDVEERLINAFGCAEMAT